jgi:hypothetical protein
LKNRASGRDPALRGILEMLTYYSYAALARTPHALADGPMLGFQ